ncbi:MAG: hypothetical protein M3N54_08570, partial [Acidobacteriota bacterium]|nr:hypothetical protein [Acidobacteriota bacterium]
MSRVTPTYLAALLVLACPCFCPAGFNPETGSYVFQQYSAQDYGASPQNWSIAQDPRGIMYFANTAGLLEFDGTSWRSIRLAGKSMVYSVATDKKGTVYVGGVGEFGFLKPDATGMMTFVSLKDRLPEADREFAQVWRILAAPEGVYFSSYRRLFRLNGDGSVKVWTSERKFGRAFYALGSLHVQTAGKGLLKMQRGSLVPVPGGERFANDVVNDAVNDGANGALIATNTQLYRLTRQGVEPFHSAAEPYLAKSVIYSMKNLPTGQIAIGTRHGGLLLMNREGGVDRIVSSQSDGLASDYVSEVYADLQGGVWLAGLNGIARFNPGLSSYALADGLEGPVECMVRHGGTMYVGTDKGLFRMQAGDIDKPTFWRVGGINDATWALLSYGAELLAATDHGVYLISADHNAARNILKVTKPIFDVTVSAGDPNVIYAAGRTAVYMLRRKGTEWAQAAELSMPGEEFRSVLEDSDGRVWATTTTGKVWRIDFSREPLVSEKFDARQGVPAGYVNARRLGGRVVFATTKGLRRYSDELKRFEPDAALGSQFADGTRDIFNVFEGRNGDVWVTGEKYHGVLLRQKSGYRWRPMPLLPAGIHDIYWMALDDDGVAWGSGEKFVLHRWDSRLAGDPERDFHVMARRVVISGNNNEEALYGGAGAFDSVRLPWRDNALRFEFSAPFYEEPAAVEYRVRLEGSDRNWSEWSHDTKAPYTHLSEGRYRLRLQARTPHGAVSEDAALSFAIAPPWYRTIWAYTFYAICAAFSVWALVRVRTRQLEEDKKRLETIVEQRTIEIRAEERKSHNLLLNILPAAVAGELKSTGAVKPVAFDDVTVCFTDFVGFT